MNLNPFGPPKAMDVARSQLNEAEHLALVHRAGAEHHACLADMYETRAARLRAVFGGIPSPTTNRESK